MMVNALCGFGGGDTFYYSQTLSGAQSNYNLRDAAIAAGWDGVSPLAATLTIGASAVIGSSSVSTAALDSGDSFPVGSQWTIEIGVGAVISGKGGAGTSCRWVSASSGYWASNGGPEAGGTALRTRIPTVVTNNGTLAGGGGGGGFVGGYTLNGATSGGQAGGGGAGNSVGVGGSLTHEYYGGLANASNGTATTGGAGSSYAGDGTGGSGGALGQAGADGTYYTFGGGSAPTGGGAAGKYADGNSYITWNVAGTRLGGVS